MISIIVPVYNEESVLSKTSAELQRLSSEAELIFTDGGSTDRSVDIARQHGKVFCSKKGRALQMNYGAAQARGDILLFLHADNIISAGTLETIERKIKQEGYIGGCLTQRIGNEAPVYRLIEWQGNIRARMTKVFYGDQGMFVKKDIFFRASGFPEVPIMEDVLFTKGLCRYGRTVVLPDKVLVSPRRWERQGILRTIFLYSFLTILFWLKVPLCRIKLFYSDSR